VSHASPIPIPSTTARRWRIRSLAIIVSAWLILQFGGIFSPGLLDDVDSIYTEIAREMLHRHDFITPYVNGIRFFDKPPLLYWMAAGSMHLFGETDWAARLPLALAVLALLLAVYALGIRLFAADSPAEHPDRGGLYSALAVATGIGPYLYTRFYIPDILIALWMTLSVHLFLIALDRAARQIPKPEQRRIPHVPPFRHGLPPSRSSLVPCLLFAAVLALNLLTKGLIGLVLPIAFVFLYLLITRQLPLLRRFHPIASTLVFAVIALPWHILAALDNPAIPLPPGLGLPAKGGWAWFYLYNEHFARFLGKRIPHDYGQTPVWLFWLYAFIWVMPWSVFLPAAFADLRCHLGHRYASTVRERESALTLTLWPLIVLIFFTFSSRQEYYSIPALPALFLMAGGVLARADRPFLDLSNPSSPHLSAARTALLWHRWLLLPISCIVALLCVWFAITAPHPAPGADLSSLLASNPDLYNLSLGHLFDLTGAAMGLFRAPLAATAVGFLLLGPVALLFRRANRNFRANITIAIGMILVLLAAHQGLVRFNPILGSKDLAASIANLAKSSPTQLTILDGEYTSGSTLVFYTRQPVHLINGRVNGLWYGSFWPDAPAIFEDEASLHRLWTSSRRINLFTYNPTVRRDDLARFGPVYTVASAGGKAIFTNQPLPPG
jgi:4-amino-4-deoxy-L-arabinose transferase-like glycosyltransferase